MDPRESMDFIISLWRDLIGVRGVRGVLGLVLGPSSASLEDTEAPRTWTESPSESPVRRCLTPSQSPFPITNGSLYSDLSLQRRNKETQKRRGKSKSDTETENHQNNESPYPSLNASLPLESYGLNVSSSR